MLFFITTGPDVYGTDKFCSVNTYYYVYYSAQYLKKIRFFINRYIIFFRWLVIVYSFVTANVC